MVGGSGATGAAMTGSLDARTGATPDLEKFAL